MAPLEPYEKVYVSDPSFVGSTHNSQGCTYCHGGDNTSADIAKAHSGVVKSPDEKGNVCAACHADIAERHSLGMHQTTAGMKNALTQRWNPHRMGDGPKDLNVIFEKHCYSCHASCGDCHLNRPKGPAKGGLLAGHKFLRTPPEDMTCTICHSARAGDEYYGQNLGAPADAHVRLFGMGCLGCHKKQNALHGPGTPLHDRYENPLLPDCTECHRDVFEGEKVIEQHVIHGDTLQCNVCHSVAAKNCTNCHLQFNEEGGKITARFFKVDESFMSFKIGRNYREDRPYKYTVVRHVPVAPGSFSAYGEDTLTNFDSAPTWKYAAPHNVQRITPQNKSCDSCHGNESIFLREKDVVPAERKANRNVIVGDIPKKTGRD